MTIRSTIALLAACAAIAACAPSPAGRAREAAATATVQARLDARLAGLTAGKPQDCLLAYPQTHTQAYGSRIVYAVNRRRLYVNETTGGCEGMMGGDYIVTVSHQGQLCRGDIGRTFQPGLAIPTGSCALGSFTPYSAR